MFDIVALGELLIDFTPAGMSNQGNIILEANPGGAPCNVLAMARQFGLKTGFIGKVGKDQFGELLRNTMSSLGIDDSGLITDENIHTTLAFVHLDEKGDRSFSFCRNPGADMMLTEQDLNLSLLQNTRIFHFGTLSMTDNPARAATKKAVTAAKQAGAFISFDPNLRPPLWKSMELAKEQIKYGLSQCDVLKISEDELEFVTGIQNIELACQRLKEQYPIKIVFVTMGAKGSRYFLGNLTGERPTYMNVKTIDTTGAGDTFCGCILSRILQIGFDRLTKDYLDETLDIANAAASLVTEKKGALKVMPDLKKIQALRNIKEHPTE